MNYVRFIHDIKNKRYTNKDKIDVFISIFKTEYFDKIDRYLSFLSKKNQELIRLLYVENIGKKQLAKDLNVEDYKIDLELSSILKKVYKYMLNDTLTHLNNTTAISKLDLPLNIHIRLLTVADCVEDVVIVLNNGKIQGLGVENNNLVINVINEYNKIIKSDKLKITSITSSKDFIDKISTEYKENKINVFDYFSKLSNHSSLVLYKDEYKDLSEKLHKMLDELTTDLMIFTIDENKRNSKVTLKINLQTKSNIKLIREYQLNRISITLI